MPLFGIAIFTESAIQAYNEIKRGARGLGDSPLKKNQFIPQDRKQALVFYVGNPLKLPLK
jgi:hypothetical protein